MLYIPDMFRQIPSNRSEHIPKEESYKIFFSFLYQILKILKIYWIKLNETHVQKTV